nr:MAG TPA: protein of unknown function (DUF4376) [Caudoviricetes sp.]
MKATRQLFDAPQERVQVCESGRILVVTGEEIVKSVESVPTSMNKNGELIYSEQKKTQYAYKTYWLENPTKSADALSVAKQTVLNELVAYDISSEINSFNVNGTTAWYDKATRVGLMNSTTIAKNLGYTTTTLWFGDTKYNLDCDKAIDLLSKIEMYAMECYNRTAAHRQAIEELTDIADVLQYDFKEGYPNKLEITL